MSLRIIVALTVSLLLHGLLLFRFAAQRENDAQLPPGAGSGVEAEEKAEQASEGADRRHVGNSSGMPAVRLAAPARAAEARPDQTSAAASGTVGGGSSYLGIVRAYLNARARSLAGDLSQRGVVEVVFEIAADGSARGVQLSLSSGVPGLDEAALKLVRSSSPLPPPPEAMRLRVPIEFH